jgi:pilus assembly protein CpaF
MDPLTAKHICRNFIKRHSASGKGNRRDTASLNAAFEEYLDADRLILTAEDSAACFRLVLDEIAGYGPLTGLFADDKVTEIMVNGNGDVYTEKDGAISLTGTRFPDHASVMRLAERFLGPAGLRVDESAPFADCRLPDGSRLNAIIPPLAVDGPVLTIRRFSRSMADTDNIIANGTVTSGQMEKLRDMVASRKTIVISGGTGSGKTTLLNILASFIDSSERLVTIEDTAELNLGLPHVIRLQSRTENIEGKGGVSVRDLVRNAMRMRPDRIIVGEARGPEALDMVQAMNTGHEGSLATVHANSARDALSRIEIMILTAGIGLPRDAARDMIVSAVDYIAHLVRDPGGRRVLREIFDVKAGRIAD